jgi:hypothetical protein
MSDERELTPLEKEEQRLLKHVNKTGGTTPRGPVTPRSASQPDWKKKQEEDEKKRQQEKVQQEEEKKKRYEEERKKQIEAEKQKPQPQAVNTTVATQSQQQAPRSPSVVTESVDAGLAHSDERAKKEAARMAKMMGGPAVQHQDKPLASPRNYPLPDKAQIGTKFELDLWSEINRARGAPQEFISTLQGMLKRFTDKAYHDNETGATLQTQEGAAAVEEALKFLQHQKPSGMEGWLKVAEGLSKSCQELVAKQGPKGEMGATESEQEATKRLQAHGQFQGKCLQAVAYTALAPREIVVHWLIDDGAPSRPNRNALFDHGVKFVGVASGPHTTARRMVAAVFAEDYTAADQAPRTTSHGNTAAQAEENVTRNPAQFQIGTLNESPDGKSYHVKVSNLQGTVDCLKLQLIEKNTMLHLTQTLTAGNKVTESHQKFGLPFAFPAADVSAEYSHSAGTLTIFLKKPHVTDDKEHTVSTFIVSANASTSESKVNIQPEQRPDCILFKCVPSKHNTEIKLVIAGKKLAFHCTHSFDDVDETGEAVVRTLKSTQTFTLPWAVSLDLITLIPSETEPQVKVMKPLPVQVSTTPVDVAIKALP